MEQKMTGNWKLEWMVERKTEAMVQGGWMKAKLVYQGCRYRRADLGGVLWWDWKNM